MNIMAWLVLALLLGGIAWLYTKNRRRRQLAFIRSYQFHKAIREKLHSKHPHLNDEQIHLVFRALRDFFWMSNRAGRRMVAMPSQVVDDAWHEFILFTRAYKGFCQRALGRFLHHTPTEAMATPTLAGEGIRRAWRLACAKERINPKSPNRLPLIFAIDAMLNIPNGFIYTLDCQDRNSPTYGSGYCAGHIGCSAGGCADDSGADTAGSADSGGFFDGLFGSNCGSNCDGGCGGD